MPNMRKPEEQARVGKATFAAASTPVFVLTDDVTGRAENLLLDTLVDDGGR